MGGVASRYGEKDRQTLNEIDLYPPFPEPIAQGVGRGLEGASDILTTAATSINGRVVSKEGHLSLLALGNIARAQSET